MRDPCEILPLVFLNAVVELNGEPFFFDDFVVGATVENIGVAVDFVAFAHGYGTGEFLRENFANFGDVCFGNVLTDVADVGCIYCIWNIVGGAACNAAEAYADAIAEFAERKLVAFVREFGIRGGGKCVCVAENRTNDAVFVIHCNKDS